nr:L-type lectin-domain containing receptor kinase IX.1-like [Tanacetum cinerariifolium]
MSLGKSVSKSPLTEKLAGKILAVFYTEVFGQDLTINYSRRRVTGEKEKHLDSSTEKVYENWCHCVDLRKELPELVVFRFSAATGDREDDAEEIAFDVEMNNEFEMGTGPRLKRVSKSSKQGIEEYASEVRINSRLRHRNLVQLTGWCHKKGKLLLVYEYIENGSLDSHLFKEKRLLAWDTRYKIAHGLAFALLLHEEWDQCILHRDIKSSNILEAVDPRMDSDFEREEIKR